MGDGLTGGRQAEFIAIVSIAISLSACAPSDSKDDGIAAKSSVTTEHWQRLSAEKAAPLTDGRLVFDLEMPGGFEITRQTEGPDFEIYAIRKGRNPVIAIYAGNHQQEPATHDRLLTTSLGGRNTSTS